MSIVGILSSNLFSAATQNSQGTQAAAPKFEQIKQQFQQLGQDLQSGNLTQAQSDYATLSQDFSGGSQASTTAAATAAATTAATTATTTGSATPTTAGTTTTGTTSAAQQFAQLGQDLQSGNLQAAQQDYTNIQQTAQQNATQQVGGHHRGHHHGGGSQSASSTSSSSQQSNPIAQAFGTLSQDLQAGNLSGAQSAFATLQNDLQQIGGFATSGSSGASPTSTGSGSSTGGTLNVSA
jgi:outer membrane protein assembly factor BamD (BamD/ComL family)